MVYVNIVSIILLLLHISHYFTANHPTYYENSNWKSADEIGSQIKGGSFQGGLSFITSFCEQYLSVTESIPGGSQDVEAFLYMKCLPLSLKRLERNST